LRLTQTKLYDITMGICGLTKWERLIYKVHAGAFGMASDKSRGKGRHGDQEALGRGELMCVQVR